jgi:TatD DNase family protein
VHSFSGTVEDGRRYIELGFYLSLSGALVHDGKRLEALGRLPLDRIVLETDAPDQMPKLLPGRLNEPSHLLHVAECIAPQFGVSPETLLDGSSDRLARLFGLTA